ncbi:MAG: hypothetical protein AAFZ15_23510 [Bacteroidota bacterium]
MMNIYSKLFQDIYLSTNGYVPAWPIGTTFQVGDIMLLQQHRMIPLGNLSDPYFGLDQYVESYVREAPIERLWQVERGINVMHKASDMIHVLDGYLLLEGQQAMIINFKERGDYFFRCKGITYTHFKNFQELEFEILQRLASQKCCFKDICVITDIATIDHYAMAIANKNKSCLIISGEDGSEYNLLDLADPDSFYINKKIKDLDDLRLKWEGGNIFFKARRMGLSSRGEHLITEYIHKYLPDALHRFESNILDYATTDFLPSNVLYPANVHEYFNFRKMNLDDVEEFLGNVR